MVNFMVLWLQALAEAQIIGLVEWSEKTADVLKYHFFSTDFSVDEKTDTSVQRERHLGYDNIKTTRTKTTKIDMFRKRITHHLVGVKLPKLRRYRMRKIPLHLRPVATKIPDWLAPYTVVVEGTLTQEEIVTVSQSSDSTTDTRYLS